MINFVNIVDWYDGKKLHLLILMLAYICFDFLAPNVFLILTMMTTCTVFAMAFKLDFIIFNWLLAFFILHV